MDCCKGRWAWPAGGGVTPLLPRAATSWLLDHHSHGFLLLVCHTCTPEVGLHQTRRHFTRFPHVFSDFYDSLGFSRADVQYMDTETGVLSVCFCDFGTRKKKSTGSQTDSTCNAMVPMRIKTVSIPAVPKHFVPRRPPKSTIKPTLTLNHNYLLQIFNWNNEHKVMATEQLRTFLGVRPCLPHSLSCLSILLWYFDCFIRWLTIYLFNFFFF